jgi:hypothetical protein
LSALEAGACERALEGIAEAVSRQGENNRISDKDREAVKRFMESSLSVIHRIRRVAEYPEGAKVFLSRESDDGKLEIES